MSLPKLIAVGAAAFSLAVVQAAERFGDIAITPQVVYDGPTAHGYREYRILVQNESTSRSHEVMLALPERRSSFGNSMQMSRTVTVNPGASVAVPLWQPPLVLGGDARVAVSIDRSEEGAVALAAPANHMRQGTFSGGPTAPTFLVSRSVNLDDFRKAMVSATQAGIRNSSGLASALLALGSARGASTGRLPYSPEMATGPPDSGTLRGAGPSSWAPFPGPPGTIHWIELDFPGSQVAEYAQLYLSSPLPLSLTLRAQDRSSTTVFQTNLLISAGRAASDPINVPLQASNAPISGLRLEFSSSAVPPSPPPRSGSAGVTAVSASMASASLANFGVDAVGLPGPASVQWAVSARASSSRASPSTPASASGPSLSFVRSELPVSDWSEQWLAYSPFEAIVLTGAELSAMPAGVATALWRYAEAGGNLVLLGSSPVPEPWRSREAYAGPKIKLYHTGFGQCLVLEATRADGVEDLEANYIFSAVTKSAVYWRSRPNGSTANTSLPIVERVRTSVQGMVVIMMAFVLLIGPVNLFVLSKFKRRAWMLWTIPAISALTCLVVFAFSLISEGVTPDVRVETVTVLDELNHRATTTAIQGVYAPLTPSGGLSFSYETEVTPLVEPVSSRSTGTPREVDWTSAQQLTRGWISSRVPAHFQLRKSETRRERLQVEESGGKVEVVNGLGAPILRLWLVNASGQLHSTGAIAAGQRTALQPSNGDWKPGPINAIPSLLYSVPFAGLSTFLQNGAPQLLRNGTYIAELEGSPFIETGFPANRKFHLNSRAYVFGLLDRSGSAP